MQYVPDYPLDHSLDCTCGHPDCPSVYMNKNLVDPDFACPSCGERDADKLEMMAFHIPEQEDIGWVHCVSCNHLYQVENVS